MTTQKVKDVMTEKPVFIDPDSTLEEAAKVMQFINCGALPVVLHRTLQGIITDRDIVTRAVAKGLKPKNEIVADFMTPQAYACNEDDTLKDAVEKMHALKVTRLVVLNHEGDVTGILSLGALLRQSATPGDVAGIAQRAAAAHIAA